MMIGRPHPQHSLLFIAGGTRSGKSRAAVARARAFGEPRVFIATAQAFDNEMRERIAHHKAERADDFITIDAPMHLDEALAPYIPKSNTPERVEHARQPQVIIIDCLTLWLSNLLLADSTHADVEDATNRWMDAAKQIPCKIIVVANEVGQGIVPENALARRFRDEAGWLNQRVAHIADEVELRFFGLPLRLKTPTKTQDAS